MSRLDEELNRQKVKLENQQRKQSQTYSPNKVRQNPNDRLSKSSIVNTREYSMMKFFVCIVCVHANHEMLISVKY
jgi:hypothetical protein